MALHAYYQKESKDAITNLGVHVRVCNKVGSHCLKSEGQHSEKILDANSLLVHVQIHIHTHIHSDY
jgi:hypothetical protein